MGMVGLSNHLWKWGLSICPLQSGPWDSVPYGYPWPWDPWDGTGTTNLNLGTDETSVGTSRTKHVGKVHVCELEWTNAAKTFAKKVGTWVDIQKIT